MSAVQFTPIAKYKSLQESNEDYEKGFEEERKRLSNIDHFDLIYRQMSDLNSKSLNYIKGCKKLLYKLEILF